MDKSYVIVVFYAQISAECWSLCSVFIPSVLLHVLSDVSVSWGVCSHWSSLHRAAHKPLALKWLIKNQLKIISIESEYQRGRWMAHEQMSEYTLHVTRIIVLCWHYQHERILEIIAGAFKWDSNFLKCKQKKTNCEFKKVQIHQEVDGDTQLVQNVKKKTWQALL